MKDFENYHINIINSYIKRYNYKSYLEIGVNTPNQPGYNWIGVNCEIKHGVDPNVDTTYRVTSDEFFEKHIKQKYDIIFIDGLHLFEQVYKDIILELNKRRITDLSLLTRTKMRTILKKLKYNQYYEHIHYIINKLSGLPPPKITRDMEKVFIRMFLYFKKNIIFS